MEAFNYSWIMSLAELNEHFELNKPFSGWMGTNLNLEPCEHGDPFPSSEEILPDDFEFDNVLQSFPLINSFNYESPSVFVEGLQTQMELGEPKILTSNSPKLLPVSEPQKNQDCDFLEQLLSFLEEGEVQAEKIQNSDHPNLRLGILSPLSRESSGFPEKKPKSRRGSHGQNSKGNLYFPSVSGIVSLVESCPNLVNFAIMDVPGPIEEMIKSKVKKFLWEYELKITFINRTRYIRKNIDILQDSTIDTVFRENPQFSTKAPYEPQYISYQVDPITKMPLNETRCGLCPYCPEINFRNFKTSTYSQHLALWHGVHTDNYLTPNPTHYGIYHICKNHNKNRQTKPHPALKKGVVCPVCFEVIETESSKTTKDKPLSGYLRHFRDLHRKSMHKGTDLVKYFNKSVGFE